MKFKTCFILNLMTILFALVLSGFSQKNKNSIFGAWKIVEVKIINADGTSISLFPKESLALFDKNKNYSFCWTSHTTFNRSWQLEENEKLKRFDQSIINAGTFSIKDSVLSTKATFALNPMFTGGIAKFKYFFKNDTLVLKGVSVYSLDNIQHPVYAKKGYIISKLLRN